MSGAPPSDSYDVIVAGGGPAGACCATLVAQAGRRVLLLERAPEPPFKLGESLMPATYWSLGRLGMLDALRASAFPKKFSVQFFSPNGKGSAPFYFFETDPHESSQTWQVLRSEFDRMLLANAREKGVEVRQGATVREVLFEAERAVGVRAELPADPSDRGGAARTVDLAARVVVDATGQSAMLSRRLGLKWDDPRLRHVAYFTHVEGARRDTGIDEGAILVLNTTGRDSWFWFIPLPGDRVSVGVVGPVDVLVPRYPGDPQAAFDGELARCPGLVPRLAGARQLFPVRAVRDFSYLSRQIAGDGWILAGDAFGFLDPIYSSGVLLALKSGELAADAILDGLAAGDLSAARLRRHEADYVAGMLAIRSLVYAFYDPDFSFRTFLRRHPDLRQEVIDLLSGNVFRKPVGRLLAALEDWEREGGDGGDDGGDGRGEPATVEAGG